MASYVQVLCGECGFLLSLHPDITCVDFSDGAPRCARCWGVQTRWVIEWRGDEELPVPPQAPPPAPGGLLQIQPALFVAPEFVVSVYGRYPGRVMLDTTVGGGYNVTLPALDTVEKVVAAVNAGRLAAGR